MVAWTPAMQAGQCWRTVRMPLFCFSYGLLYIFMVFFAIIKSMDFSPRYFYTFFPFTSVSFYLS